MIIRSIRVIRVLNPILIHPPAAKGVGSLGYDEMEGIETRHALSLHGEMPFFFVGRCPTLNAPRPLAL